MLKTFNKKTLQLVALLEIAFALLLLAWFFFGLFQE